MDPSPSPNGPHAPNHPSPADGSTYLEGTQFEAAINQIQPADSIESPSNEADYQTRLSQDVFGPLDNLQTVQRGFEARPSHNPDSVAPVEAFPNPLIYRGSQTVQPYPSSQSFHQNIQPAPSSHFNQHLSFSQPVQPSYPLRQNLSETVHPYPTGQNWNQPTIQPVQPLHQNFDQFHPRPQPSNPSYIDSEFLNNSRLGGLWQGHAPLNHQQMDQSEHWHQGERGMMESVPVSSVSGDVSDLVQTGHGLGQSNDDFSMAMQQPPAAPLDNVYFPRGAPAGMGPENNPMLRAIQRAQQRLASGRNLGPPAAGTDFQPQGTDFQPQGWGHRQTEISQGFSNNSGSMTDWHDFPNDHQGFQNSSAHGIFPDPEFESIFLPNSNLSTSEFLEPQQFPNTGSFNDTIMPGQQWQTLPALRPPTPFAGTSASTSNVGSFSSASHVKHETIDSDNMVEDDGPDPTPRFVVLDDPAPLSDDHGEAVPWNALYGARDDEEGPVPAADTGDKDPKPAEKPPKRPRTSLPGPSSRRHRIAEQSPSDSSQSPVRRRPAKRRHLPAAEEEEDDDFAPISGDDSDPRAGSTKRAAPKGKAAAAKPKTKARAPRPGPGNPPRQLRLRPEAPSLAPATTPAAIPATTIRPATGTRAPRFTRPPKNYGLAARAAAPAAPTNAPPPQQPARLGPQTAPRKPRRQTNEHPLPARFADRDAADKFIVESKAAGMTYRAIRKAGGFTEAESTLRGRYRGKTKTVSERRRKPQWTANDLRLLERGVRTLARLPPAAYPDPTPATGFGVDLSEAKIPWKAVAEWMVGAGASYRFGNSTVCKKWEELVEGAKRDGKDLGGPLVEDEEDDEEDEDEEDEE